MARARRGRGEASIFQRESDGLWVGSVSLGYNAKGKRQRKTIYGKSKSEVAERLRQLQAEHDAGRLASTERLTVADYLRRWLTNTAKPKVHEGTFEGYQFTVERHLVPTIGGVMLTKLSPLHVEQAYSQLQTATADRKGLSARARKMAATVLSMAMKHAVKMGLVPNNPAANVAKAKPLAREMTYTTRRQTRTFLDATKANRLYPLFALALGSGMRQGELLALTWADIDFDKGSVTVARSLSQVKGKYIIKEPKSASGRRSILLPAFALDALREHRAAALKAGQITAPVFCTTAGTCIGRGNLTRLFKGLVKAANVMETRRAEEGCREPDPIPATLRFHDMRHSHASNLIADGHSIKAVSRRLGHADITITLKVYAHLMPNDDEKLAEGVNRLFG